MRAGRLWGMGLAAFLLSGAICRGQDSLNVTKVGEIAYWGEAYSVAVVENIALVACTEVGLRLLDVSNPSAPIELGYLDTPGGACEVVASGNYAYLADYTDLRIIDISDPANPQVVGICPIICNFLDIEGQYVFAGTENYQVKIVDVSDPAQPEVVGQILAAGIPNHLEAIGDLLLITEDWSWWGAQIFDVSNPSSPYELSRIEYPEIPLCLAATENYAYISFLFGEYTSGGISTVDIANPSQPQVVSLFADIVPSSLETLDTLAYALFNGDFIVVNMGDPLALSILGLLHLTSSDLMDLAVSVNTAYVAQRWDGLSLIDTSDPFQPSVVATYNTINDISDVTLQGDLAYVSAEEFGIRILDIYTPQSPAEIGCFVPAAFSYVHNSDIADSLLFLAASSGFWIVDVSDPSIPALISFLDLDGDIQAVKVSGDMAYLAAYDYGLYIVNIANPTQPFIVHHLALPDYSYGLDTDGSLLYIAQSWYGLIIMDISDPSNPVELGHFDTPSCASDVKYYGGCAYIADGWEGLRCIDVSNPSQPVETWSMNYAGWSNGIDAYDGHAYLASTTSGLHVLQISPHSSPIEVGNYNTPGYAFGVAAAGNYAYVADRYYFGIYDVSAALPVNPWETTPSQPSSFVLHPPHPNPFNPITVLTFDLPVAGLVKLEVFDINGRDVGAHCMRPEGLGTRSVPLQAGTHQIPFDGSGLPSGIYLARLTAGDFSAVQKLILLK